MKTWIVRVLAAVCCFAAYLNADPATQPDARIAAFSGDRIAALTYTFDDNLRDQYTLAYPILKELNLKATFYVVAGRTAETPEAAEKMKPGAFGGISWPELKEMAADGQEIGNHTLTHANLTKLTPEQVEDQIVKAHDLIREKLGQPPLTLAYPYNARTPAIRAVAMKYHLACRESQKGVGTKTTLPELNAWADKIAAGRKWGVVMIHAMKEGYEPFAPDTFRQHLRYVSARPDRYWIDTFANVARYEQTRDAATLEATPTPTGFRCLLTTPDSATAAATLTLVLPAPGVTAAVPSGTASRCR